MAQSLDGEVAVVTGAGLSIGLASARCLAREGVRLALVGRSRDRLEAAKVEVGGDALVIPADLTRPAEVEAVVATAAVHFGRCDFLFANAGAYVPGDAAAGDPDAWDRMIELNVNAVFRAVRAVLPGVIERRSGDIVLTSSVSGHQAIHGSRSSVPPSMPCSPSCMACAGRSPGTMSAWLAGAGHRSQRPAGHDAPRRDRASRRRACRAAQRRCCRRPASC